jgi:CelD/BcsL family acetyltransferase involved in cellulose biosynthesis
LRIASNYHQVLEAKFIVDLDALQELYAEWDALALSSALPSMAPGWVLAWWRHVAPKDALLRVVEIRDGSELVGLAPFFVAPCAGRRGYCLLGRGSPRAAPLAPLALPGYERQVAQATGRALSQADPRPDLIELPGTRMASRWHLALREGWPGRTRPIACAYRTQTCPTVSLEGTSLEAWLAGRSSKFRSSMRRLRRRFEEEGGSWRMSTEATLRNDIETFRRLHAARWEGRGESTLADAQRVGAMLNDVGRRLLGEERFRLWVMEIDGEAIGADIYLAGGGVVLGFNGGWDERWKRLSPPLLATMHAIEDAIKRGESRLDLGPGGGSHKTRFADGDHPIAWSVLMMPGRRLPQTLALTAPVLARGAARSYAERVLKPEQVHRLRDIRRQGR